jgi:hypothetical protein
LDSLGTTVIESTKESFKELKEVFQRELATLDVNATIVDDDNTSLQFQIHNYKFVIKQFDTVALSHVNEDEFFNGAEILTNINYKKRYSGRIIFYFSNDQIQNLILGEFFINEDKDFIYHSGIGHRSDNYIFHPRVDYSSYCLKMLEKGIENAFFEIETTWKKDMEFDDIASLENQGRKIGF